MSEAAMSEAGPERNVPPPPEELARQRMEEARKLMEQERTARGQVFLQQVNALAQQYRCELVPEVIISSAGTSSHIRVRVLD